MSKKCVVESGRENNKKQLELEIDKTCPECGAKGRENSYYSVTTLHFYCRTYPYFSCSCGTKWYPKDRPIKSELSPLGSIICTFAAFIIGFLCLYFEDYPVIIGIGLAIFATLFIKFVALLITIYDGF